MSASSTIPDTLLDAAQAAAKRLDQAFQVRSATIASTADATPKADRAILREKFRIVNEYIETNEKFQRWVQYQTEMLIDIQSDPDPGPLVRQVKDLVQKSFVPPAVCDLIDADLQTAREALSPAFLQAQHAHLALLTETWTSLDAAVAKTDSQETVNAIGAAVTATSAYFDVALLPAKLLREQYVADLQRPFTTSATQPLTPARQSQPVKRVLSSQGDKNFSLHADDAQPVSVPTDFSKIMVLFLSKVLADAPCEVVCWPVLNEVVGEHGIKKSSTLLRKELFKLNGHLRDALGSPPAGDQWIETVKGEGARLNPSVDWSIGKKLKKLWSSVYDHPVNPTILAEATTDRNHRLPAKPRRNKKSYDDDLDE